MGKTKDKVILFSVILIMISGIMGVFSGCHNSEIRIKEDTINRYSEQIVSGDFRKIDRENLDDIKDEVEIILADKSNKEIISKGEFILGYIDIMNLDRENAIYKLNKSIENFTDNISIEVKAKLHYELSKLYISNGEYKRSENEFNKIRELCRNGNEDILIRQSIYRSYDLYNSGEGLHDAIDLLEEMSVIAEEVNYESIYHVYFQLGVLNWYADRTIDSINYKLKALNLVYGRKQDVNVPDILNDIAIDYLSYKNYDESLKYLYKALEYDMGNNEYAVYIKLYTLMNLVNCYNKMGDLKSSNKYYEMFKENIDDYDNPVRKKQVEAVMNSHRADYEIRRGNPSEALKLLDIAKAQYEEEAEQFYVYNFDVGLYELYGDAYYKLGNYEEALKYHKKAEEIALQKELTYLYEDYSERIYMDYKAMGDLESAMEYLEKNNKLKSELNYKQNAQYTQYLLHEFEAEKNIDTILSLKVQKNIMCVLIISLTGVVVIAIGFGIIILKKNKEIVRLNEKFKFNSVTDGLTNIANRRALDEFLSNNWQEYMDNLIPVSFVMIDIDYFKRYNDNYGHVEGDKVLREVAETIKESCRKDDFVVRYGGEEFIIIMDDIDKRQAIQVVERIQENICKIDLEHKYSKVSRRVTLSIGISTAYGNENKDYDDYISDADKALYIAKESGRNRYVHFEDIE